MPIGIDAASTLKPAMTRKMVVLIGTTAAVGFAVAWIQRPGFGLLDGIGAQP